MSLRLLKAFLVDLIITPFHIFTYYSYIWESFDYDYLVAPQSLFRSKNFAAAAVFGKAERKTSSNFDNTERSQKAERTPKEEKINI